MTVVPIPPQGEWFADARSGERAMRVSWHGDRGCVVLSTWRGSVCVGTVRLSTADAARLIAALAGGLASDLAAAGPSAETPSDAAGTA